MSLRNFIRAGSTTSLCGAITGKNSPYSASVFGYVVCGSSISLR
jgi:hypothetical protein